MKKATLLLSLFCLLFYHASSFGCTPIDFRQYYQKGKEVEVLHKSKYEIATILKIRENKYYVQFVSSAKKLWVKRESLRISEKDRKNIPGCPPKTEDKISS